VNVSDLIIQFLADHGVRDVFMVSGGGIMYLTDALGRAGSLRFWCNYHEQACAIAAEGYARITGTPGVCLVTSGPGATNALSGIAGAWVDSIPVIVISGQVRRDLIADYSRWRQLGPQEIDILDMARPVTKLAIEVGSAGEVADALARAWEAATTGRPGPVWLSVPLDVQGADVPVPAAPPAQPVRSKATREPGNIAAGAIAEVVTRLRASERPLIVAGNGIHLARAESQFDEFVRRLRIPVVTTIGGMDILGETCPQFMGRFGPTGQRRANFTVQNADLLLCLATGMSVAAVGFDSAGFAPKAAKVLVNVDRGDMTRPHLQPDMCIEMDVRDFMPRLLGALGDGEHFERSAWTSACASWKARYPLVTDDYLQDVEHVNTYALANAISMAVGRDAVLLTGNSLDATSVFHSFAVTKGQRVITNVNFGAMGWDLPALVGACVARPGKRTILVTGDGSIQFNSQELLTIGANRLNAVIFILNNGGYQSIRSTQQRFAGGRLIGADEASGVSNPNFEDVARANGLRYRSLANNDEVNARLAEILSSDEPTLCEVNVSYTQERTPRVVSQRLADGTMVSGSLQDQFPYLPPSEVAENMQVSAPDRDRPNRQAGA
jgi:acetolactate synthase-1/2/3 large subunit